MIVLVYEKMLGFLEKNHYIWARILQSERYGTSSDLGYNSRVSHYRGDFDNVDMEHLHCCRCFACRFGFFGGSVTGGADNHSRCRRIAVLSLFRQVDTAHVCEPEQSSWGEFQFEYGCSQRKACAGYPVHVRSSACEGQNRWRQLAGDASES